MVGVDGPLGLNNGAGLPDRPLVLGQGRKRGARPAIRHVLGRRGGLRLRRERARVHTTWLEVGVAASSMAGGAPSVVSVCLVM